MIRFIPGFVAAIAAYIVIKLVGWATSLSLQILIYLVTYVAVAVIVDYMMKHYGDRRL